LRFPSSAALMTRYSSLVSPVPTLQRSGKAGPSGAGRAGGAATPPDSGKQQAGCASGQPASQPASQRTCRR
jgi:hypothetical protein